MNGRDLAMLGALSEARLDRERARLQGVLAQEARLRAMLSRLDAQAGAARALPAPALDGLRGIGADLSWQGWVARQRATLQMELAMVLARKEQALPALRQAFGEAEAALALDARARAATRRNRAERAARTLSEFAILRQAAVRIGTSPDQTS